MLDQNLIDQLKEVFSKLENPVRLRLVSSAHGDQAELREMLSGLTQASGKITLIEDSATTADAPAFSIEGTGISFLGIPGGHEFSSLVLSVLYADGKGKQPDAGILARIRSLKGPIRIKTYISLTCENCPEVVQALNLMATHHPDFRHEMVDGGYVQDEIEALGIQGVPSVVVDGKLVHSGKIQFLDLLAKLEQHFGVESHENRLSQDLGVFDVAVIGGGPAGASAAIYSARKGLKTAMVAERFGGQLQETKGIENMISVSYTEGPKLAAQIMKHVSDYPISQFEHRRVKTIQNGDGGVKLIEFESGEKLSASSIILATGAKWRELGIPGERDYIGQGVAFCAHCDGPFYKAKRVAVVGGGNSGVEAAIDLAGIATHVTLFEYNDKLKADDVLVEKLKALANVEILLGVKTSQVIGDGKKVIGLEYVSRENDKAERLDVDGVFVQIGLSPNSQFVKGFVETTAYGEIVVDGKGRTSVPGIYAAGDVTTIPFKQIVTAMGDGAKVALTAFEDRMRA
ncbi:MAG: alkyl hydroperoxide reductase subunit F [Bdellovibrionales bacterium]|jgi:alkyl hydroperoxide reductase subunit F|nr:alkyl hydroperoxide reductase subunit F [Bdellovibrionales bacterium]